MSKALRSLQITAKHQDGPFFTVFLPIKKLYPKISRQRSYRFRLIRVPRNTAASKIGNSVISLL